MKPEIFSKSKNNDTRCTLIFGAGKKYFMKPEIFLTPGHKETRTLSVLKNFVLEKNVL